MSSIHRTFVLEKTASKSKKQPKKKPLTNFVRKTKALTNTKELKYAQFEPLYALWCDYFNDVIGEKADAHLDERLLRADYHGALLMVIAADNSTQIGIRGFVVRETRYMFQLITPNDRFLTIPKAGSTFQFVLAGRVFTLFGNAFLNPSAGRSQKKIKAQNLLPFFLK